jgi:hypothetical protein
MSSRPAHLRDPPIFVYFGVSSPPYTPALSLLLRGDVVPVHVEQALPPDEHGETTDRCVRHLLHTELVIHTVECEQQLTLQLSQHCDPRLVAGHAREVLVPPLHLDTSGGTEVRLADVKRVADGPKHTAPVRGRCHRGTEQLPLTERVQVSHSSSKNVLLLHGLVTVGTCVGWVQSTHDVTVCSRIIYLYRYFIFSQLAIIVIFSSHPVISLSHLY